MKKNASLFLAAILGGFVAVIISFFVFKKDSLVSVQQDVQLESVPVVNKALIPSSSAVDFTIASQKALNAVVYVKNKTVYTYRDPLQEMFYGRSEARKKIQIGTGSGVIISADGYIVTNNHVIEGATELEITLNNKKTYPARIIGADKVNDIALVKIDAEDLPYVSFSDSDHVKVGEWVLAVGNPYNLTATVTAGIVSAKGRDLLGSGRTESYIQTDAVVNSGNSGGALVNIHGELIGINTIITSNTGSYIGYSFAVPSNITKKVVEDILEFGDVQQAYIGISYRELNGGNNEYFGVENTQGVIILDVLEGTGAKNAGVLKNDIIIKADHVEISTFSDLKGYLNTKRPNDVVNFTIVREGKQKQISVTLFERKDYY